MHCSCAQRERSFWPRSLWAQLQCIGLLHRHRLRRKTQNHVNDFGRRLAQNPAVPAVGEALYALGYSTEYVFVRAGRTLVSAVHHVLSAGRELLMNAAAMAFPGAAGCCSFILSSITRFFSYPAARCTKAVPISMAAI